MYTRRLTRRAATIDAVNSIPTKLRKTRRTTRNSFSNSEMNSNSEAGMPTTIENGNENSNATEDEGSTQPLFPGSDPTDILAQADLLLAQMDAYALETSARQNNSIEQRDSDTEQKPSTSTANENVESPGPASNEQSLNRKRTTENTNRSANDSTSIADQSQCDDSVILIDDVVMPRPNRSEEDVIFVEEYVKEAPRITGVVDLCDEEEEESAKKKILPQVPMPAQAAQAALASRLPTSPVASTSSGIVVKCPICLDTVPKEEIHSTICGHLFCGPCIKNTVKTRKKCPMCNRLVGSKQIHRIFFDT